MCFQLRFEGERLERGRVAKGDRRPARFIRTMAVIRKKSPLTRYPLELLRSSSYLLEVRSEELKSMTFREFEGEATLLLNGILNVIDLMRPSKVVSAESVVHHLIRRNGVGNAVGRFRARESKTTASGRRINRVQVKIYVSIKIVNVNATITVKFWDFEVGIRAEEILNRFIERMK